MKYFLKKTLTALFTAIARKQVKSMGLNCKVNFYSKFTGKTSVGNNSHFNGMKIYGYGEVQIGNNFHSGKECLIITSNHNYDSGTTIPYDDTYINKNVTIEDNVWIGTRVILLGGIVLEEGCIIQAGSVVVTDIPKYAIAGGSPAKVFKYRNIDHYEQLKAEGCFVK